ncbi:APC family permease [Sulfobacillus harzensis]|uniref:APC family permease n=1 Tax=Sulfobacillus harzensis TaxID=2729629 RepID=A0A7Y0L3E9_9FIRM|nr:APC family permease [Sulfobacillus harzensis]NMP22589.1 APC family permease [Sulfobacillus harzensis]
MDWRRVLIGRPLKDREGTERKVNVFQGLAVLAPDALSSVAYGTQEILIMLSYAGMAALWFSLPISATLVLLLAFLVYNYRQIIAEYPNGGGAYVIGRDTLGPGIGLIAGAALLIDYTLTVAVSVTAGVAALVSAFPRLGHWTVWVSVLFTLFIMVVNLRGTKESAQLFAFPTYLFIAMVLIMVGYGLIHPEFAIARPASVLSPTTSALAVGPLLLLRAFSSGSSALTGIEAISNGVPIFRNPAPGQARTTLMFLGILLGAMFFGTSLVANRLGLHPNAAHAFPVTVLQLMAGRLFGRGVYFYLLSFVTMAILAIAANTGFAGFPQLASTMARDQWMPRMFLSRGDRLVYQNGILVLGGFAILLIILFKGNTAALIPLYAVGVYMSFTIAMVSLVKKRWAQNADGRRVTTIITAGLGAVLTTAVVFISVITKFTEGAWIVVVAIPLMLWGFRSVRRHYRMVADILRMEDLSGKPTPKQLVVIVPVASINQMTMGVLSTALSMNPDELLALHIATSPEREQQMTERWKQWNPDSRIKLVVVQSQYRAVLRPMVRYIDHLSRLFAPGRVIVVIPELLVEKRWQNILHNHMGFALEAIMVFRRSIAVMIVPYRLPHKSSDSPPG